jgi:aryl-alcohol dehydrogenase-like predicted oxidoreductase
MNWFSEKKGEIHMRYRLLGKGGLRVSEAALGTMTFGDDGGGVLRRKKRKRSMRPTARQVEATKYTNAAHGNDPNAAGNYLESMMQAVEASLKRLQTDFVDLYWVHILDQITPVEEVMRAKRSC